MLYYFLLFSHILHFNCGFLPSSPFVVFSSVPPCFPFPPDILFLLSQNSRPPGISNKHRVKAPIMPSTYHHRIAGHCNPVREKVNAFVYWFLSSYMLFKVSWGIKHFWYIQCPLWKVWWAPVKKYPDIIDCAFILMTRYL